MARTAGIYIRRSQERNGEESVSISQQLTDAKTLAKKERLRVDEQHIYIDANLSGKLPPTCWTQGKSKSRPALSKLIEHIESGEPIVAVICRKRDRLARNLVLAMRLYEFFAEHKVKLLCTNESLPASTDASGKFTLAVLSAAAELTLQQTSENYLAAKRYMKSQGQKIGPSYCLGYRELGKGRVEVDEVEAEIVREVFRQFAAGASKLELVRLLNEHHFDKRKKKGRRWWFSSIDRLLTNTRYIGLQTYGDGSVVKSAAYPTIVDPGLFHQCQQLFKARRGMRPKVGKHPHLLSGFLRCGDCGRPLRAATVVSKQKRRVGMSYACNNFEHKHQFKPFRMMESCWIDWLDSFGRFFVNIFFQVAGNKGNAEESGIKTRLAKIDENLERLQAQVASGEIDAEILATVARRAKEERLKLQGKLATMSRQETGIQTFIGWGGMNFQQKRIALASAIVRIDVYRREAVVHLTGGKVIRFPLMVRRQLNSSAPTGQNCLTPPKHIRFGDVINSSGLVNWKPYYMQGYFFPFGDKHLSRGASKRLDLVGMTNPFDEAELDDLMTKEIGKGWKKRRNGNVVTWSKGDCRRTAIVDPKAKTRRMTPEQEIRMDAVAATKLPGHKKTKSEDAITYTSRDGKAKWTVPLRQPVIN